MDRRRRDVIMVKDSGRNKTILVMASVIAVLIIVLVLIITLWARSNKVSEKISDIVDNAGLIIGGGNTSAQVVEHTTTIDEIIGIDEIQTLEYKYDAICRVFANPNDSKPAYYIAYTGTVSLGIDGTMISTDYGTGTNKVITVKLPSIQILSCTVNAGTLDYLFIDQKYNNQDTSITAQAKCEEDLRRRIEGDEKMFEYAMKNAESQIRALTEPLVSQIYPDYQLEIEWKEG